METLLCLVPQRSAGVLLPLYKYIPAGDPESAFEIFMHGNCDLNGLLMGSGNALAFYVQGILPDEFDLCYGDLAIVHKRVDVQKGDIILIEKEDGELHIKWCNNPDEIVLGIITSVIKFQKKIFTDYHISQLIKTNPHIPDETNEFDRWAYTGVDLNKVLVRHPRDTYLIEVLGDSMKDSRIYSGDIVLVDKSLPIGNNDIIAARINGEVTLKRYEHALRPKLVPANPQFRKIDIPYNEESIMEGVVVVSIQRLRKV